MSRIDPIFAASQQVLPLLFR